MIKSILNIAGMLLLSMAMHAQVANEGMITYSMEPQGIPEEQAAMMKGMENKFYFKNGKVRSEVTTAFGTTIIVKDEKDNVTTLMDMMGQKSYLKTDAKSKSSKVESPDPQITYTEEKKTIAGYECKKAVVETKDENGKTESHVVWYTEKLPYVSSGGKRNPVNFKGLKGAPMEFEKKFGNMTMKIIATSVSLAEVPDSKFKVSTEGYTQVSEEDIKRGMMGGGK